MAAFRPGRQQTSHFPSFGKRRLRLPGENRRDADIHLPEAADVIPARRQHLAELGPAVGHGNPGLQGHPQHFPGIGRQPRGDIHRQNRRPQMVEPLNDQAAINPVTGELSPVPNRASTMRPALASRWIRGFRSASVQDLRHRDPQVGQNLQVDPGIIAHLLLRPQEENGHRHAGVGQVAGDHETVAAIVAPPGHHRYFAPKVGEFPPENLVGRPPGILHQDQGRDAEVLYGPAVQLPHLGCRHEFHISTWIRNLRFKITHPSGY